MENGWYKITWDDDSCIVRQFKDGAWATPTRNPPYDKAKSIEPVMVVTKVELDVFIADIVRTAMLSALDEIRDESKQTAP